MSGEMASKDVERPERLTLTIDGQQVVCDRGDSVLVAARRAGIEIPALCYEPRLPAISSCRLCLVEIEGARKLTASCTAVATEGMVVRTTSERIRRLRRLYLELLLSDHNSFCAPPCRDACPANVNIPQFLDLLAQGDAVSALRKLREDLPFPGILGRVCTSPCESSCRSAHAGQRVAVRELHRFAGDCAREVEREGELLLPVEPSAPTGRRIAIVGAGPAGLAAAFYSRLEGHEVTVLEAMPHPGGLLRYGIPAYQLPREVLDDELAVLWRLGVELRTGVRLGADYRVDDLFDEGFHAVFLALGSSRPRSLGVPGEDSRGVVFALDLLREHELTGELRVGRKVVVVGDGFAAIAAARSALRAGAGEVVCAVHSPRERATFHRGEVDDAEAEGVRFAFGASPVRVLADDGVVAGVEFERTPTEVALRAAGELAQPQGSGFTVDCDQVIVAVGRYASLDATCLTSSIVLAADGTIAVDPRTLQTADPRVFAGGDAVHGPRTAIEAIAHGKRAAWGISAYLNGLDMAGLSTELGELGELSYLEALRAVADADERVSRMAKVPPTFIGITTRVEHVDAAPTPPKLAASVRRSCFDEVEATFDEADALRAAALCLQCSCPSNGSCQLQRYGIEYGVHDNRFEGCESRDYPADFRHDFIMREPNRCINCGRCVHVCRLEVGASCYDSVDRGFNAIVSTADNLPLQLVGCISCGRCAETCPTGAIETNPRTLISYDLDESRCIFCGDCVEACPYGALEQTSFFELASYSRSALASESLYVREEPEQKGGALRRLVADVVPNVRKSLRGLGWLWTPLKDDPIPLDDEEEGGDA